MWQYQYGDGDTETTTSWFTGGDTENIANNIDEKSTTETGTQTN